MAGSSDQMNLPFFQVDVFGGAPFKGNPVAVILEGDKLTSSQMLEIAKDGLK